MLDSNPDRGLAEPRAADTECPSLKTHFYEFKEFTTFMNLIDSVTVNCQELTRQERAHEQFLFICDQYQEQPHLIDKYLSEIFDKLIGTVKFHLGGHGHSTPPCSALVINECFKYMHCLAKMRGFKKIVQYLPHEIADFEPVLKLLAAQDSAETSTWQTRYMLLLWLSIIGMIPFDMNRFDANVSSREGLIMNRLLDLCVVKNKNFLIQPLLTLTSFIIFLQFRFRH